MHKRLLPVAMRILIVTETLALGGAETFALRLAHRLRNDGHAAEILCLNPDLENVALVAQYPDVPIHRLPITGLRTVKRIDRALRRLGIDLDLQQRRGARWVGKNLAARYDIYHGNLFGADWLLTLVKRRHPGMKIVSTLHGDYMLYEASRPGTETSRILRWRAKLADVLASVDRWVTISPAQHRQFVETFMVDPSILADIPNGYAPTNAIPAPAQRHGGATRFVMVARGMREKGWGFLVAAFARLEGDVSLTLIGEGAYLGELKHQSRDANISFTGAHPNPVELIGQSDIFIHPSIYAAESMPTVIVEALFAGLPVIATDIGSVATMIAAPSGELAGQLLAPNEATLVDDLTAAMQAYVDDPALRARHAALAPAAFAKFDMGRCAAAYVALYAEVATNSSTKASH